MGTWGAGLYEDDIAADLRDSFTQVVHAPWDAERILDWARENFGGIDNPASDDYCTYWLVLADLFWTYRIEHPPTRDVALRIIAEGIDLDRLSSLGADERHLQQRARMLAALAAKWQSPNPRPRRRRIRQQPEPFALEAGDCVICPLKDGEPRNPYMSAREAERYYGPEPWTPDGWGSAFILARWHRYELFARYLVALPYFNPETRPTLRDFTLCSILHQGPYWDSTMRQVHVATTSRQHLTRMRAEVLGRLMVNAAIVAAEFTADHPLVAAEGYDLSNSMRFRTYIGCIARVHDPLARYLA